MAYTAEKPNLVPPSDVLRERIPGWGADLDPADRPAVPKAQLALEVTGAHWTFPDRQIPRGFREKSTEHAGLTPVFGTACPLRGISGLIRRFAYRYSEGQTSHWMLLVLGDRVDVIESSILSALRLRPDRPLKEMGLRAELRYHGLKSRRGQHRADLKHLPIDIAMFAGKGLLLAGVGLAIAVGISSLRASPRPSWRSRVFA